MWLILVNYTSQRLYYEVLPREETFVFCIIKYNNLPCGNRAKPVISFYVACIKRLTFHHFLYSTWSDNRPDLTWWVSVQTVNMFHHLAGCSKAVICAVMKRGVKAELCSPFMSVREDMEGEERAGFVYTGDYLISMSSLRGASEGSRHSATTTEPPKAKYSLTATIQKKKKEHKKANGWEGAHDESSQTNMHQWKQHIRLLLLSLNMCLCNRFSGSVMSLIFIFL